MTIIIGDSSTGKSLLYQRLQEKFERDRLAQLERFSFDKGISAAEFYNYGYLPERLNLDECSGKVFIMDNAELLLQDYPKLIPQINEDYFVGRYNQFILMGRNLRGLNYGDDNLFHIVRGSKGKLQLKSNREEIYDHFSN